MTYFNGVIVFIGTNLAEYIFILAVISLIYFMVYRKIIEASCISVGKISK